MMERLCDIAAHLDEYLHLADFSDSSQNGLQVAGKENVRRVVGLVDASREGFEAAAEANADMVIVHHGLLWGKPVSLTGIFYERVRTLIENSMSLYAAHLPLDAHPEVGNNARLIACIGAELVDWFAEYGGKPVGCIGKFKKPRPLAEIVEVLDESLNTQTRVFDFGPDEISTVGIVSGAACEALHEASARDVDLFITGEPRLNAFHEARELELNVACAGHYATECIGVQALIKQLPSWFDVETLFIDVPCEV